MKNNPTEAFKTAVTRNYLPKSGYLLAVLVWIDIIGIFASAVYLLFFR